MSEKQEQQNTERSRMLGTMEMRKLVPTVSVPIMVSMLVQALYNIVDGIFVGQYSPDALTAVNLAMPMQMLMIAVSTGMGMYFDRGGTGLRVAKTCKSCNCF